jgi:hypothetical protein
MIDSILSAYDRVAELAATADRDMLQTLLTHVVAVNGHMQTCICLGTLPPTTLMAANEALNRARAAIRNRMAEARCEARAAIDALPEDRPTRAHLMPVVNARQLSDSLRSGAYAVNCSNDDAPAPRLARVDGVAVEDWAPPSWAAHVDGDHFVVGGVGRWPMDDVVATAVVPDVGFSLLTREGVHVEILQAA